jgi:hypothetical protein
MYEGGCFLRGDAALCSAHRRSVAQRVLPRAVAHLRFDRLQPTAARSRYTMVLVNEEQALWGVEDDDGRQGVEHLGEVLHSRGVEMCLRIDRRVGEEIGYSHLRHIALIVSLNAEICNPHVEISRATGSSRAIPITGVLEA